jgi:predicted DNA-binding transcriptional regulator AlpA
MTTPSELLTPDELVTRWDGAVTTGTLANWRSQDRGPRYVKIGRAVRYRLADIVEWENEA